MISDERDVLASSGGGFFAKSGVWIILVSLLLLGFAVMRRGYGASALSPISYPMLALASEAVAASL